MLGRLTCLSKLCISILAHRSYWRQLSFSCAESEKNDRDQLKEWESQLRMYVPVCPSSHRHMGSEQISILI